MPIFLLLKRNSDVFCGPPISLASSSLKRMIHTGFPSERLHSLTFLLLQNKGSELTALWRSVHELREIDRKRLDEFKSRYESLKEIVDARINLGAAFQQVCVARLLKV